MTVIKLIHSGTYVIIEDRGQDEYNVTPFTRTRVVPIYEVPKELLEEYLN